MIIRFIFYFIDKIMPLLFIAIFCYVICKNLKSEKKQKPKSKDKEYKYPPYLNEENYEYYSSEYYQSTHLPIHEVMYDKGRYGEYMVSLDLQEYKTYGAKLLFNCYLPRGNNQTTEADIILLTLNGIFVIESKNYSGWIFGDEKQETWTQTLKARRKIHKERFFNPIMQNKTHIRALKNIIGSKFPIYSVIVFSNACTLQDIKASDPMTEITYFGYLNSTMTALLNQRPNSLTQEDITSIYNKLYPYTQVPEEVRQKHAEYIQAKNKDMKHLNSPHVKL